MEMGRVRELGQCESSGGVRDERKDRVQTLTEAERATRDGSTQKAPRTHKRQTVPTE